MSIHPEGDVNQISWRTLRQLFSPRTKKLKTSVILWGPWMSVQALMAALVHPVVAGMSRSGPKRWTDGHCHPLHFSMPRNAADGNCWGTPVGWQCRRVPTDRNLAHRMNPTRWKLQMVLYWGGTWTVHFLWPSTCNLSSQVNPQDGKRWYVESYCAANPNPTGPSPPYSLCNSSIFSVEELYSL